MGQTNRSTSAWPALAVVLAVSFSALQPAVAADSLASEREQLAALARQLDLIDRLVVRFVAMYLVLTFFLLS